MGLGLSGFDVGGKHVGDGSPCLIVAEVAQAHEGSLMMAHAYIDAIADAGADAVKVQVHVADAECAPSEPWRIYPRWAQDANRHAYWKRMEFDYGQWQGLATHARERGLIFLASPFSTRAVALIRPLVPAWKVASGEINNHHLLRFMARGDRPMILSSGMATRAEFSAAVRLVAETTPVAILQCTSEYPTPPEHVGLSVLQELREQIACPVGLSDHSGSIYAGLGAVALGCDLLEVHVTFSREMQGFDTASSITMAELSRLVEGVRFIERAKAPLNKDEMARELAPMRDLFMGRSQRKAAYDAERTAQV